MQAACAENWTNRKAVEYNAIATVSLAQRRNYLYNEDENGDKYLAGTYDNFTINGRLVNDMWLESHF